MDSGVVCLKSCEICTYRRIINKCGVINLMMKITKFCRIGKFSQFLGIISICRVHSTNSEHLIVSFFIMSFCVPLQDIYGIFHNNRLKLLNFVCAVEYEKLEKICLTFWRWWWIFDKEWNISERASKHVSNSEFEFLLTN